MHLSYSLILLCPAYVILLHSSLTLLDSPFVLERFDHSSRMIMELIHNIIWNDLFTATRAFNLSSWLH